MTRCEISLLFIKHGPSQKGRAGKSRPEAASQPNSLGPVGISVFSAVFPSRRGSSDPHMRTPFFRKDRKALSMPVYQRRRENQPCILPAQSRRSPVEALQKRS